MSAEITNIQILTVTVDVQTVGITGNKKEILKYSVNNISYLNTERGNVRKGYISDRQMIKIIEQHTGLNACK